MSQTNLTKYYLALRRLNDPEVASFCFAKVLNFLMQNVHYEKPITRTRVF